MGVTSLWPILSPCARPTPLPTLNRTRLAVDASIWIYQFLKAVRDKEGNALRNSHVVGFFRRICKLLFFGVKPVFVFDGGAPALKRQTILGRKRRREGRRDDAVRTAGKLLAVQMQRRAEEEEERRARQTEGRGRVADDDEEALPSADQLVYVDEIGMTAQERVQTRKFTKKDAYHLPELTHGIEGMGQPDDPRIMSTAELEEYARQFNSGEDINLYDFSKIDFDGEFFMSLPAVDRYNILNAARLRSRLRMGLSKDQLEEMFPDRMEFSRFQIERVRERNELTQRLMNLNGINGDDFILGGSGRIAGDQKREYVLVKNEGVEGGWALGVVSTDKEVGERNKPIDVDSLPRNRKKEKIENEWEDEEAFEDIPIEGLNRLPKLKHTERASHYESVKVQARAEARSQLYKSRKDKDTTLNTAAPVDDVDSLFVAADDQNVDLESHHFNASRHVIPDEQNYDEDLERAIALSLQQHHGSGSDSDSENADFEDVPIPTYQQRAAEEPQPIVGSGGNMVAHIVNNRANAAVPKRRAPSDSSDEGMDLQAILAASRRENDAKRFKPTPAVPNQKNPFDGPLPFEKLDFKGSLFGNSKALPSQALGIDNEDFSNEGGFEHDNGEETARPLPPWLVKDSNIRTDYEAQRELVNQDNAADRAEREEDERLLKRDYGTIDVDSSNDSGDDVEILESSSGKPIDLTEETAQITVPATVEERVSTAADLLSNNSTDGLQPTGPTDYQAASLLVIQTPTSADAEVAEHFYENEAIKWSDSDRGTTETRHKKDAGTLGSNASQKVVVQENRCSMPTSPISKETHTAAIEELEKSETRSPSPIFEDVDISHTTPIIPDQEITYLQEVPRPSANDVAFENQADDIMPDVDFDEFSDPEDEELLAQLAAEAEEHARFASTLNKKTAKENQEDYERELKALRSQQKKDRRDADEVSHIMIQECQALLRLFGLPYITAPMEAEAQCAELVRLGLVDGIVTDDSDVFLFGGTRVYKNMFNSNKYVECYLASDLVKELSLSREQLIDIAQLLGSDYTEGLPGIGPVTALEILSEFPDPENGLKEFREWWSDAQAHPAEAKAAPGNAFRRKFWRQQGKKLFLPPAFPNEAVRAAYLHPEVDSTPEPFQWGVPDLDKLRGFLMATIGWSSERTDEVLVPVIRDMNRRETDGTQANITRYFSGGVGVGARHGQNGEQGRSVRMNEAVKKLKAKKTGG